MVACRTLLIAASLIFVSFSNAGAEDDTPGKDKSDVSAFDTLDDFNREAVGSSNSPNVRPWKMTTAELRQARALYRANQRTARIEHNLWIGHDPLRPTWNNIPVMSSRYRNYRTYVPYYYWAR